MLLKRGLLETHGESPDRATADLHRMMVAADGDPDLLSALAELSYLDGQRAKKPAHLMAVGGRRLRLPRKDGKPRPGSVRTVLRAAADWKNSALSSAFGSKDGSEVVPRAGSSLCRRTDRG